VVSAEHAALRKDANNIADQLEISMTPHAVFDEMTFRYP
jgi:hypothetical protein